VGRSSRCHIVKTSKGGTSAGGGPMAYEELTRHFERWLLSTDMRQILLQGKQQPTIDLKPIWERLGEPNEYRHWRANQIKSLELNPDIDFRIAPSTGAQFGPGNREDV